VAGALAVFSGDVEQAPTSVAVKIPSTTSIWRINPSPAPSRIQALFHFPLTFYFKFRTSDFVLE
jgi:hypothetical protein